MTRLFRLATVSLLLVLPALAAAQESTAPSNAGWVSLLPPLLAIPALLPQQQQLLPVAAGLLVQRHHSRC